MVGLHSSTPVKTCKQNIVGNINDTINIRPIVNREDKYSESLGKSALRETCKNAWVNGTSNNFVLRVYVKAIMT